MKKIFVDKVHRRPRIWSNQELRKFSNLFDGNVVNVSAYKDQDKQGSTYKSYFKNAHSYSTTNFLTEANGLQGTVGEFFLDLEEELDPCLTRKYDVVLNHTTLEHVYEFRKAFANLCKMSDDVVILVLPFLQQYHAHYGDYWRFSPEAIQRLFAENDFALLYQSFNNQPATSVYVFSIAARNPHKWKGKFGEWAFSCHDEKAIGQEPYIGCHALPNRSYRIFLLLKRGLKSLLSFCSKR